MNLIYAGLAFVLALLLILIAMTRVGSWLIEGRHPPAGSFAEVDGTRLHYVHIAGPDRGDLPPIVFLHGASANLMDQMVPLRPLLEGRAEMLFLDRPGHGWSDRGPGTNETPSAQAATIAGLMDRLGIENAIIVGHSFGASVAAAVALERPDMTRGLLFLSAASHPWPGGATSWYYGASSLPALGRLFTETITLPVGTARMAGATECVFAPNPVPPNYSGRAAIPLVLRPAAFRANAIDVNGLYGFAVANAPRYSGIAAPTLVISGDSDTVVYEEIHSVGLARDIAGAELVWVRNLGHKPDWVAPDLVVAAIEKLAGRPVDLRSVVASVEARIAEDSEGKGRCFDAKAPAEAAPLP